MATTKKQAEHDPALEGRRATITDPVSVSNAIANANWPSTTVDEAAIAAASPPPMNPPAGDDD